MVGASTALIINIATTFFLTAFCRMEYVGEKDGLGGNVIKERYCLKFKLAHLEKGTIIMETYPDQSMFQ